MEPPGQENMHMHNEEGGATTTTKKKERTMTSHLHGVCENDDDNRRRKRNKEAMMTKVASNTMLARDHFTPAACVRFVPVATPASTRRPVPAPHRPALLEKLAAALLPAAAAVCYFLF